MVTLQEFGDSGIGSGFLRWSATAGDRGASRDAISARVGKPREDPPLIHTAFVREHAQPVQFDEFDGKIIQSLLEDGRMVGKDLSTAVGLSEATISRRCGVFAETHSFDICGFFDPWQCGCAAVELVSFAVQGNPQRSAERIAAMESVHRLSWMASGNRLCALVTGVDAGATLATRDEIAAACPDLEHVSTETLVGIIQGHDPGVKASAKVHPLKLRESARQRHTDLRLIRLLQQDLRMTYTGIAAALGTSITLSGEHTKRIMTSGAVRPIGVYDRGLLGNPLTATVHISYSKGAANHARALAQKLPANLIYLAAGPEQVIAEISVADENGVFEWIEKARHLGETRSIRWDPMHAIYKQTYDWAIPGATPSTAE